MTIEALRQRSESLFTQLLTAQTRATRARRARGLQADRPVAFSWFEPGDAVAAVAMSFRLSALAASESAMEDGLAAALDHAEAAIVQAHPEEVRQGLALFVTHNRDGRRLAKPRTVNAAPGLFGPPGARGGRARSISIGGASPGLDYWREDALANEHHQHWHEVYPFTGLPPRDFRAWATDTSRADMVAILEALAPGQGWQDQVAGATVEQLAGLFAEVVRSGGVSGLPAGLYRTLFRLNDRQGELFFYMHQQMLARYDAELVSHGLEPVSPFGPPAWGSPIEEGHDPVGLADFRRRDTDQRLRPGDVDRLQPLWQELETALEAGTLRGAAGDAVPIDRTNLGEAAESVSTQLRDLDPSAYRGLHNTGHVAIARLSPASGGVMRSTLTAIRDQVFWRWHKFVDNINASWQDSQDVNDFADRPPMLVRNGLDASSAVPWASPDIILCRTSDLPENTDPGELGEELFGGTNWSTDFTAAEAVAGDVRLASVNELVTTMATVNFDSRPIRYLTHEPYSFFVRIQNRSPRPKEVTVRVFLAPAGRIEERRAWIEMDKFLLVVPGRARLVAYRSDTDASVVKRPVDTDPTQVLAGDGGPDDEAYCDCGWPYTLLLPRGTAVGMEFRLVVICTDATVDRVPEQGHCGSMSFCGAVDRYPDTRDMGYPFARRFAGPTGSAIRDAIVGLPNAAARTVTIRHA